MVFSSCYKQSTVIYLLIFIASIIFLNGCSNQNEAQDSTDSVIVSDSLPIAKISNIVPFTIKDSLLRSFIEEFTISNTYPIKVDKYLYDSSKIISEEYSVKYLNISDKNYYNKLFFGTRFLFQDSIIGLIYHYEYSFVPQQIWMLGSSYIGTNIMYINYRGEVLGDIKNAYYKEKGGNENGEEFEKDNATSIFKEGNLVVSKTEKVILEEEGIRNEYEEISLSIDYLWVENKLQKGSVNILEYQSEIINTLARKMVLDSLNEIADINFIGVIKQGEEYYRINENCVAASKFHIIDYNEELKSSEFSSIHVRYLPIWADENNEYSSELITNAGYDKLTEEYYFKIKNFEIFRNDYPFIKMSQEGREIRIVRSNDGYWMVKSNSNDDKYLFEEKFALTLPVSDYSCNQ